MGRNPYKLRPGLSVYRARHRRQRFNSSRLPHASPRCNPEIPMRGKRVRFLRHDTTVPANQNNYVIDNATENMMKANPGMDYKTARKFAVEKLVKAIKAAS